MLTIYYGLIGAVFNSEIRKNIDIKPKEIAGLKTLGVANHIIEKEVQENLWTPSLPVFFPTYFLDNLPNFQLGEIKAVNIVVKAINSLAKSDRKLDKASELLSYNGRVWMFEKGGVLPVPSAASQYKKGRVLLRKSNPLDNGFKIDEESFLFVIKKIERSLAHSLKDIDSAYREDENIDDAFYYNQGKIYVYALFLQALSHDYKNILIETNLYEPMTTAIKALEDATEISPSVVKNSDKSSGAANHLYNMGYYLQKALSKLNIIKAGLKNEQP